MTDEDENVRSTASQPIGAGTATVTSEPVLATVTTEEIFEFLCRNKKIFFKSQQIDDPELTREEKRSIAREIFNDSRKKFLLRFGKFLHRDHLRFFELNNLLHDDEIEFLVADFMQALKTRNRDVKNRRYSAMQSMIKADNYFSEREMMKREPHLYEQLIGQYLTDTEKRNRDRLDQDEDTTPFSRILLDNYDNEQMEDLRKQQKRDDISDDEDETTQKSFESDPLTDDDLFPKMPASYRKQWGNFEDDVAEQPANVEKKPAREQKYITAGEREMLRQEFMGIMYTKFLDGEDRDFDYTAVDDNTDLDDLEQIAQDNEDKYFDADDEDVEESKHWIEERMAEDESEDELDIYMKDLNTHPNL